MSDVVSIDRWTLDEYWLADACYRQKVVRVDTKNLVTLALHRRFPEVEGSPLYIKVPKKSDKRNWTPEIGEIVWRFANRIHDLSTRALGYPFSEIIGVPTGADDIVEQIRAISRGTPVHPDLRLNAEKDTVMVLEDTITRADSLIDFLDELITQGKKVRWVCACFYRGIGGLEKLRDLGEKVGFTVDVIFTLEDMFSHYWGRNFSEEECREVLAYHQRIKPYLV